MSKQILMYKDDAGLTDDDLAALRESGFVPIKVTEFDSIRIIDPLESSVDRSVVFQAAVEAIAKADSSEGPKSRFGRVLAEKLSGISFPAK